MPILVALLFFATAASADPAAVADGAASARIVPVQAVVSEAYQQRCANCHGPLETFARRDLVIVDGVLTGKDNGKPVASFLTGHGRLRPDEIPLVVEALTRVLADPAR